MMIDHNHDDNDNDAAADDDADGDDKDRLIDWDTLLFHGNTALSEAVREGHKKVAEVLYEKGGKLMWSEDKAASELCEFARNGDLERIKILALCGCPINAADYDGRTCLHLAASVGNKLIVTALLEAGSDLNFQDRWGGTPLSDAVREGHREISHDLIERWACQLVVD